MAPKEFKPCKKCAPTLTARDELIDDIEKQNATLGTDINALQNTVIELQKTNQGLDATIKELKQQILHARQDQEVSDEDKKKKMEAAAKAHGEERDKLIAQIRELTSQSQVTEGKLEGTTQTYHETEAKLRSTTETLEAHKKRVRDLEGECKSAQDEIGRMVAHRMQLQEDIGRMEEELAKWRAHHGVDAWSDAVNKNTDERRETEQATKELYQKRMEELVSQLASVEGELERARATVTDRDDAIAQRTQRLHEAEADTEKTARQCAQQQVAAEKAQAEIAGLGKNITELTAQLRESQNRMHAAEFGDKAARRLASGGGLTLRGMVRGNIRDLAQLEVERNLHMVRSESRKIRERNLNMMRSKEGKLSCASLP